MKKILSVLMGTIFIISMCITSASAFALPDVKYEVPIRMKKVDKNSSDVLDEDSMAADVFAATGILEIKNGRATLIMPVSNNPKTTMPGSFTPDDLKSMGVKYFTSGKVGSSVSDAEITDTLKVSGTEYKFGYKIPLAVENDAAIKFNIPKSGIMAAIKIPGMPDTANAGMRIDYASAVDITPESERITAKSPLAGSKSTDTASSKREVHSSNGKNVSANKSSSAKNVKKKNGGTAGQSKAEKAANENTTVKVNTESTVKENAESKENAVKENAENKEKTLNEGKNEKKSESENESRKSVWPWVAGGVSAAVIIAAAVAVFLKRNGKI